MKPIGPTIAASVVAAVLCGAAQATALSAGTGDGSAKSMSHHEHETRSVAERGEFQCSLTAVSRVGRALVTASTLSERVVVELSTWRNEDSQIRVHRSVLERIIRPTNLEGARDFKPKEFYARFLGSMITPQNDTVVANFETNALAQTKQQDPAPKNRVRSFSGFKAYLGRRTEQEENGRQIDLEIYFRIIIDWSYQSRRQDELSLHRAALVISQVSIGDDAGRERFYRFLPSLSPFRMLACVLDDAQVI